MRFHVSPAKIVSAVMLIAVVNVYVFANGAMSASSKGTMGRLVTTSNRPVLVNGSEAVTGTVILSGAHLITSAASFATVQLDNVATVTIAPSSDVVLNFDAKNVTVRLASGDATVAAAAGVVGNVVDASSGKAPTAGGNAPTPATVHSAQTWGIAGVAVGSAAFIWAIIAWNRANDARDSAAAANAAAASLASQLAALRTCLAGQTTSPIKLCTSF